MKIQIDSSVLFKACSLATKNIPSKVTIPIISNLLIEADSCSLKISSTDMESWVIYNVPATVELDDMPAKFCINAANVTSLLSAIPSQPITIEVLVRPKSSASYAKIKHSCGTSELPVQSADEYPTFKPIEAEGHVIPAEVLKQSIQSCRFALFADVETFPELTCMLLDFNGSSMVAVGTDKNRMVRLEHPEMGGEKCRYLLPPKTQALLLPALDDVIKSKDAIDSVMVRKSDNISCVQTESVQIYFRHTERRFPNYDAVIPAQRYFCRKAVMNRQDLISAVTRASLFANAGSMLLKLRFDAASEYAIIEASDVDFETSSEEKVRCEYEGEVLMIGMKATFLKEILQHLTSERVLLSMIDQTRQIIFTEENGNPNILMLMMPMMLNV